MPQLRILIGFADDVTASEADLLTRQLLYEIERLDVDEVVPASGTAVEGVRAADPVTVLGVLTVLGVALKAALPQLIALLGTWVEASAQRSVVVEFDGNRIEVTGRVRPEDVERYVAQLRAAAVERGGTHEGGAP